ncbi:hypothetical protein XENOCAPTIV_000464 [Xenoophorus captivus]|uniref:Uncharacterized protein n=1 Tax=Xenoophorus captivus TaxID=1517983 RepID=A0ABV0REM3_9TELE
MESSDPSEHHMRSSAGFSLKPADVPCCTNTVLQTFPTGPATSTVFSRLSSVVFGGSSVLMFTAYFRLTEKTGDHNRYWFLKPVQPGFLSVSLKRKSSCDNVTVVPDLLQLLSHGEYCS